MLINNLLNSLTNIKFSNLDLLSVGITTAAIFLLGFIIYLSDRDSETDKSFLLLAISASFWSIFNYLSYQSNSLSVTLFFLRLLMFCAVWFAFSLFRLLYVFPRRKSEFPRWYKIILMPATIVVSLLTLTPLVFDNIVGGVESGKVPAPATGFGIIPFAILVLYLVGGGIFILVKKVIHSEKEEKRQFLIVLWGIIITFTAIILLNFILPAFFSKYTFIPFGALFIFPFIAFTFYAIVKHKLLDVKVISTEIISFFVIIAAFVEVIISKNILEIIFRSVVFVILLIFSILLIKSVIREVKHREQLESLSKRLSDFLSFGNHEVKGALTVFSGYLGMILDEGDYPVSDEVRDVLKKMAMKNQEIKSTVDLFLDVNKIELNKFEILHEPVDMVELTKRMTDQMKILGEPKNITIEFISPSKEIPKVNGDAFKLPNVIVNLLSNAIKYNNNGGWVRVGLDIDQPPPDGSGSASGFVKVTVADNGIGIAKENIDNLFNKYERISKEAKKIAEGSGLGLFIAKKIVELHGGRIWAESEGEGRGSRFCFTLPIYVKLEDCHKI